MKKSFANEFKNNYSSAISRDINSIKENKEFETKGEKFTFKTKNQMDNNDIFTNENLMSNNEVPFVYTFRSVNENDEEFFRSENIMQLEANTSNYYEVTHTHTNENVFYNMDKDRDKDKQLDKDKDKDKEIDKYGSNISDRNTNYQSVLILSNLFIFF